MSRLRLTLFSVALCVALSGFADVRWVRLDSVGTAPYEGVWRMTGSGAIFAIEPKPGLTECYALTLLWSPDLGIPSGSELGEMRPAGRQLVFDAVLGLDHNGGRHISGIGKKYRFELEFSPGMQRISFKAYKQSWRVNIFRWLPYLFRTSVSKTDTRPADIDGAVRLGEVPAAFIYEL